MTDLQIALIAAACSVVLGAYVVLCDRLRP
jgi:hypothetical protein